MVFEEWKSVFHAVTMGSTADDELCLAGFVREELEAQDMPADVLTFMAKWYCNERVMLSDTESLSHWAVNFDEIIRQTVNSNSTKYNFC